MENLIAKIAKDEIPVTYSVSRDVNLEFLRIQTEGWDEVKKLTKKVLLFEGRRFTRSGWYSNTNEAFFRRPWNAEPAVAKSVK